METTSHITVLINEAVDALQVQPSCWYIDATLGGGGHTKQIRARGGYVIALDQDLEVISRMKEEFSKDPSVHIHHANFENLAQIVASEHVVISGVLFDLGLSSDQLADESRGFSTKSHGSLDMRMNITNKVTAMDLLHGLTELELTRLLAVYGEVYLPRRVAHAICVARENGSLQSAKDLTDVVVRSYGHRWTRSVSAATQVFQALRIAVNDELEALKSGLFHASKVLTPNGRIVVISFHSLEDRIVKQYFNDRQDLSVVTKKAIVPSVEEIEKNPRAHSAKMRVSQKMCAQKI